MQAIEQAYPVSISNDMTPLPRKVEVLQEKSNRILWLDISRGLMILIMFFTHSFKLFSTNQVAAFGLDYFPFTLHYYTFGFVALSGFSIYSLRNKLSKNKSIFQYSLSRSLTLILICFCLQSIKLALKTVIGGARIDSALFFNILTLDSDFWGGTIFVVRIAIFLFLAGAIIKFSRRIVLTSSIIILVCIASKLAVHDSHSTIEVWEGVFGHLSTIEFGFLGMIFAVLYTKFSTYKTNLIFIGLMTVASFAIVETLKFPLLDTTYSAFFEISFLVEWVCRVLMVVGFAKLLAVHMKVKPIESVILTFSKYAFFAYLIHRYFGKAWKLLINELGLSNFLNGIMPLESVFCFLFVCILTYMIIFIRERFFPKADRYLKKHFAL